MKNYNTLTQHIIANQPEATTVAVPQTISLQNIERKRMKNTAAQEHILVLSPPVDELMTENKNKIKNPAQRSLKKSYKNLRQEKESRESNVA